MIYIRLSNIHYSFTKFKPLVLKVKYDIFVLLAYFLITLGKGLEERDKIKANIIYYY